MSHGMENWHPNPGLLLPARRRPGPRRRPLLRRQPHQPDRPGEARRRARPTPPPPPARSPPRARSRARTSRSRRRPPSTRCSSSPAAPPSRSAPAGTSGATATGRWSSTAPTARIFVPDPNWFGGKVELVGPDGKAHEVPMWDHPFAVPNDVRPNGSFANYRTAGLADMALAIIEGRDARCGARPRAARHRRDDLDPEVRRDRRLRRSHHHLHPPRAARPRGGAGAPGLRTPMPTSRRRPLRRPHGLPALRRERPAAPGRLARPLAQLRRRHAARDQAGDLPHRLRRSASPTSTSPTTTARRRAPPRPPSARSSRTDFAGLPRRADHLVQGRLPDVARPLRRVGQPQVPARLARPEPEAAWASTMSTSSTPTASTPTRRSRRPWARSTPPSAPAARSTPASPPTTPSKTREAAAILKDLGTPCVIHQPSYNMINRWVERDGLKETLKELGIGSIAFTPLAQGMLTGKYLKGIPEGSRATQGKSLRREFLNDRAIANIRKLNEIAEAPRPDPRADGHRLGAARRRHHLGAHRRLAPLPGRGLRRRGQEPRLHRGRARRDRPLRQRGGHQPLGPLLRRRMTRPRPPANLGGHGARVTAAPPGIAPGGATGHFSPLGTVSG